MSSAQSNPSAVDRLTAKQAVFVREFMVDFNGAAAARRAGYSEKASAQQAARMLTNVKVGAAIRDLVEERSRRLDIEADEMMRAWLVIANANPNELTQYRRLCCRHCWGQDFGYQHTPGEYKRAKLRHDEKRAELIGKSGGNVDIGEFDAVEGDWYQKHLDPNPECPECFGEGKGETFFQDTRKLSPSALALFAGVRETREGLEILMNSQEKARENLARALGLFREQVDATITVSGLGDDELYRQYVERMDAARERQRKVLEERGLADPEGEG